jgi:3',5'-cyclic-AMP phosphodiesterase
MLNSSDGISLLHITDTHIMASPEETLLGVNTAYYLDSVLANVINSGRKFDFCLVTGDIAQNPCEDSYRFILKKLQLLNIPCICLPGNHDELDIMLKVLSAKQVNCCKQLVMGKWQILCLNSQLQNSAAGYLSEQELKFLEQCLSANPKLMALIAVHHHCVHSGSSWMDTMMIENAKALFDIIDRYPNAKAVINGHIHQAMDLEMTSCRVLTTPSTCFQFKPLSEHFNLDDTSPGYRWINLYNNGHIDTDVVRIPEKIMGLRTNTEGY